MNAWRWAVAAVVVIALGVPGASLAQGGGPQMPGGRAEAPPAQAPRMPDMTGQPMEHPTSAPPWYRERTFLVLVGVAMGGTGFAAYRLIRSRRRRTAGAARFVSEAVLVVDLVESTRLATHYGDGVAMRARTILKERILAAAEGGGLTFAESTGDGCLMTFPSVAAAVRAAVALLEGLRDQSPDVSPGPALAVRAGVSYGEIVLDARGSRHGAAINKAFRLQGLTRESFASVDGAEPAAVMPDRNRILADEQAAKQLEASGLRLRFLGFATLKGFPGLHRVYEVPWEAPPADRAPDRPWPEGLSHGHEPRKRGIHP